MITKQIVGWLLGALLTTTSLSTHMFAADRVAKKERTAHRCHKHKMPFGAYGTSFDIGNLRAYGTLGFGPDGIITGGASNTDIDGGLVDITSGQIFPDPIYPSGSGWGIDWIGTFKRVGHNRFVVLITNLLVDKGADPALPGPPIVRSKIVLDLSFSSDLSTFTGTFTVTAFPLADLAMSGPPLAPPVTIPMNGAKIEE